MDNLTANQLFAVKKILTCIEESAEGKAGKSAIKLINKYLQPWEIAEVTQLNQVFTNEIKRIAAKL